MKNRIQKIISVIAVFIIGANMSFAQDAGIQRGYQFEIGDVICSTTGDLSGSLYTSKEAYDNNIVGVYAGLASDRRDEVIKSKGVIEVNVSSEAADIKKGDYVTSSPGGKAIKSTGDGMVIGVALDDAIGGKVRVRLAVQYVKGRNITKN